jgi:hypothetical protein
MSLWGSEAKYCQGAVANARLAARIYPDWTLRVYCDPRVTTLDELRALGAEVRVLPRPEGIFGMFWRFWPAAEPEAEYVVVRDADSRLNVREKAAVDAWIRSGEPAHVMRDHEQHRHWPMLGGLWGCRGGLLGDIKERSVRFGRWTSRPDDMHFLVAEVWPRIKERTLVHTSVRDPLGGDPFPPHAPYDGFVGQDYPAE